MDVPRVRVDQLHLRLNQAQPFDMPTASRSKPLVQWRMEDDDAPIFRYVYRSLRPRRHLEFGTWRGSGALYVLEESDATVWTLNLPEGERTPEGRWVYYERFDPETPLPAGVDAVRTQDGRLYAQTDGVGFIGKYYRDRGLSHRVCQIYCDSRQWDTSNYPEAFFDTVLIDGGHSEDVVASDTRKAMPLLRPGGVVMWHDYCPDEQVVAECSSVQGVLAAIGANRDWLTSQLQDLFWIEPSWILMGIKR